MNILVIGASGTIGSAVIKELAPRHNIITAGLSSGDYKVNIEDTSSILSMYQAIQQELGNEKLDAVVATLGKVHFGALTEMTEEQFNIGLYNKLMGQIRLVLLGKDFISSAGSFTLTSGILNRDPIQFGSSAAMVNGAIDGFVKSAAIEMPNNLRINAVSPTVISEAMKDYAPYFRGFKPVSAAEAALAYAKSVEGLQTGQVYTAG